MELSGCGDECRRTADFYAALRCYKVLSLASLEWIPPSLRLKALLYWNLLQYLTAPPLQAVHKNTRFTKTLCSQYYGKSKQSCRNVCIWSNGECKGCSVSRHEPLDITHAPLGRLANTKIYWPISCYMFLLTAGLRWPENNLRGVRSVTSPSSATFSSTLVVN